MFYYHLFFNIVIRYVYVYVVICYCYVFYAYALVCIVVIVIIGYNVIAYVGIDNVVNQFHRCHILATISFLFFYTYTCNYACNSITTNRHTTPPNTNILQSNAITFLPFLIVTLLYNLRKIK